MDPPPPLAGFKTLMFFHLEPADGMEKYLGAWAHMLAASDDTIDLIVALNLYASFLGLARKL